MDNCVYRFLNKDNEIIYIGKAKILKNRLNGHKHLPKECYDEIVNIEYVSFESEYEMDLAERYLIPKHKPKYNIIMSNRVINLNISEFDNLTWMNLQGYYKKLEEHKKKNIRSNYEKVITSKLKNIELENIDLINSKIICMYTGVIFENIVSLYEHVISKCSLRELAYYCNGESIGKGLKFKHPNYPDCIMMPRFLEVYNNLDNEDKEFYEKAQKLINRQIYCITTNELFDNSSKARYKYKINSNLSNCCNGVSRYVGTLEGKPLVWVWYDDYLNMESYDVVERMEKAFSTYEKRNKNKKIKCA